MFARTKPSPEGNLAVKSKIKHIEYFLKLLDTNQIICELIFIQDDGISRKDI